MRHPPNHIFEHNPDTLTAWCAERSMPAFRATQILEWVYRRGVIDPAHMSNLSKRDRETLAREMTFLSGDILAHQIATDGTQKMLIQWSDDDERTRSASERDDIQPSAAPELAASLPSHASESTAPAPSSSPPSAPRILRRPEPVDPRTRLTVLSDNLPAPDTTRQTECVMIPTDAPPGDFSGDRRTACISSQVGCPVGCKFCASGLGGLDANLSAGRINEQVWRLRSVLPKHPHRPDELARITNVVFMGMGEPLANFRPVTSAIRAICGLWGHAISARKVTISTVGVPKAIERLAEEFDLPVTLALSLHAPTDEIRRRLIPWAEYSTIEELLAACQKWFDKTGREITLEYTLLGGVNDRPEHAEELARLAKTLRANVNLIRYNEVKGMPFSRPATEGVRLFQEALKTRGVNAHIRASRGRDIAAACGQLRHEKNQEATQRRGDAATK